MPALHIIDVARVAHETRRRFFWASTAPEVTAAWGDLPEDARKKAVDETQKIVDETPAVSPGVVAPSAAMADLLRFAVVNALRPFVEE